ncbi:MAG: hypothetical protein SGBAC_011871 [Bacillariaceae sp.]
MTNMHYEQPFAFDETKQYVTDSQLDEADALLLGLEKSMDDKNWASGDFSSSLYQLDSELELSDDIFEPYPLAHPSDKDSRTADLKMFLDFVVRPTKPDSLKPVWIPEAVSSEKKRVFPQSTSVHSQVTSPAPKRSRICDPVQVESEKSETTQVDEAIPKFRDYQEQQWQEQYQGLLEFKRKHGHCCVPNTYEPNTTLGRWVKRQRYQYKLRQAGQQSTLVASRVRILEEVGFVWDSHAALWEERLNELKHYRRVNGHCNVPSTYPKNKQLSTWVKCQRRQFRLTGKGKNSNLTAERIAALDDLGFVWDGRTIGNSNTSKHVSVEKTRPRSTRVSRSGIAV